MEHPHDLIAEHALGASAPGPDPDREAHLAACPDCRAFAADLREMTTALAFLAEPVQPPAGMRERVLAAALPAHRPAPGRLARTRRWAGRTLADATRNLRPRIVAPVTAAFIVGMLVASAVVLDGLGGGPSHPPGRPVSLGPIGSATVWPDGTVAIDAVSTPPSGHVYEAWLIRDGRPAPDGLLPRGGGELVTRLRARSGDAIAITAEPVTGSHAAPTGVPLVTAAV